MTRDSLHVIPPLHVISPNKTGSRLGHQTASQLDTGNELTLTKAGHISSAVRSMPACNAIKLFTFAQQKYHTIELSFDNMLLTELRSAH